MSTSSERFQCAVDGCESTYAYASKSSLKAHQRKKHADLYQKQRGVLDMKRFKNNRGDSISKVIQPVSKVIQRDDEPSQTEQVDLGQVWNAIELLQSIQQNQSSELANLQQLATRIEQSLDRAGRLHAEEMRKTIAHVTDIRQQVKTLAQKTTKWCVVCFENENEYCFEPCNHKCVCKQCVKDVYKQYKHCPICRTRITGAHKVYDLSAW